MKNKKYIFILLLIFFFNTKLILGEEFIYKVEGKKVSYFDNNNLIITEGEAVITDQNKKKITANKIIYNKKKTLHYG